MSTCNLRDHRRLLATPIGTSLLRIDLALDLYARNPFRMLVTPAWLEDDRRDALVQRFRNLYKLRPEAAMGGVLRIGYEELADIRDPVGLLNDLREPQRRLVWELFWPHVGQKDFNRISAGGVLNIPKNAPLPSSLRPTGEGESAATPTTATSAATTAVSPTAQAATDVVEGAEVGGGKESASRVNQDLFFASTRDLGRMAALCERDQNESEPKVSQEDGGVSFQTLPKERLTDTALWTHTLAILHHNRALAIEVSITASIEPLKMRMYRAGADEHWRKSFGYWAATIANPIFWEYLKSRVAIFDDPQLQPSHLEPLRDELPAALLAFNATLLRAYVGAGCMEDAARHMRLLGINPFRLPLQQSIMVGLVREVANAWLNPLIQQLESQRPREKCSWRVLRDWLTPIIESAEKLPVEIKEKFGVDEITLAEMQFDNLAEKIFDSLGPDMVDYQPSSERTLLFLLLVLRKILGLPLSASLQRKVEERRGEYTENLYGRFYANPHQARQLDPTECWFLPGELADPEASLLLPVHKPTSEKGKAALWSSQEVLVPRSQLADTLHLGKAEEVGEQRQAEADRFIKLIEEFTLEAERDKHRIETACAAAIAEEDAYRKVRMRIFDEELFPEETPLKTEVQKVEDSFRPRISEVEMRLAAARATTAERWTPALVAARKTLTRLEPLNRLVRVNLPLVVVIGGAMALSISTFSAARMWAIQYLTPLELVLRTRWYASDYFVEQIPVVVAILLTVILTIVFTEIILAGKARAAQHKLQKTEERHQEALAWIDQVVQEQRDVILREQEGQLLEQRTKLQDIAQRREVFTQEMNQIVASVQSRHQQEIERRQATFTNHLVQLQLRLDAYKSPPKTVDEKGDFTAYVEALRIGYLPGEQPQRKDLKALSKRHVAKLWPF
ncbi:hypothetical protein CCP3SC1_310009 [Gammaproteobacteria bacterium]